ncbi:hypothetical protein [Histophilus somni]|nr:hypothetical protein [Histophilus somni]
MGKDAKANGIQSVALGDEAQTTGNFTLAFGRKPQAKVH